MESTTHDEDMADVNDVSSSNQGVPSIPEADFEATVKRILIERGIEYDKYKVVTNRDPDFKFKYPEAAPTPEGEDDVQWNKVYTAADSRMYNKNGKSASNSKKIRATGDTYKLALKMLEEKKNDLLQQVAVVRAAVASGKPIPTSKPKPQPIKKVERKESFTDLRDDAFTSDNIPMSISEKIKSEGRARKVPSDAPSVSASSNHGSPAPTMAPKMSSPAPPKVDKPPKKRGIAAPVKKQTAKKPKVEDKAGTPSTSNRASQTPGPKAGVASDSESNDGGEYCICRGPDDHRMMVECEGGCGDWYHCSCVGLDVEDAKELLDRYVCPKCTIPTKSFTTWKPMCRYYNVGHFLGTKECRRAARVSDDPPSKYCSDEHKEAWFKFFVSRLRQDDEPSKGGALNVDEFKMLAAACMTEDGKLDIEKFHALGKKPRLPKKGGADPERPVGLDYVTTEEAEELAKLRERKRIIKERITGFEQQRKLLIMVSGRAEQATKELKDKSICGYDSRLAMNEAEFALWLASEEGKTAFATGVLGPRTEETKMRATRVPQFGFAFPEPPKVSDKLDNICTRVGKKCKHKDWLQYHNNDYMNCRKILMDEYKKLTAQEDEIIDDAETREATKSYYAHNTVTQLF